MAGKRCKFCDAPIVLVRSPQGRHILCDDALVPYVREENGKELVVTEAGEWVSCRLDLNPGEYPTGLARLPHRVSCPCRNKSF